MRRIKKVVIIIAVFLGIYALTGFIILPMVLETVFPDKLAQALKRPVRVAAIRFNPFTLTLRVEGLDIRDKNGSDPFVAFDALLADVQTVSLFKMGLIVNTLQLDKPTLHLARMNAATFNFSDLSGAGNTEASGKDKEDPQAPAKPFRYAFHNIAIHQGSLFFRDKPMKKDHSVSNLNFVLPLISNFEEDAAVDATATLTGVINDAELAVDVKTRPFHVPLEATINLALTGARIPYYFDYVPGDVTGVDITTGLLDVRSEVHFMEKKEGSVISVQGDIGFADLALTDRNGEPVLNLPKLTITVAPSRPLDNKIQLASVKLQKPSLFVNRSKEGVISLTALGPKPAETEVRESSDPESEKPAAPTPAKAAPAKASEPAVPDQPFSLAVGKFAIDSGRVTFVDHSAGSAKADPAVKPSEASLETPTEMTIDDLNVLISDFSISPDKIARFDVKTRVNREGNLSADGQFGIFPLFVESDFALSDIKLAWAQPYFPDAVKSEITDGRLSASGSASIKTPAEGSLDVMIMGKAAIRDLAIEPIDKVAQSDAATHANPKGNISVEGRCKVFPLSVESDFTFEDVSLKWAQPYIPDNINLTITDGLFAAAGKAVVKTSDEGKIGATITGKAAVKDFASEDSQDHNAFVSWKTFSVEGLNVVTLPLSIGIDKILLIEPQHRFVLYEPGVSSVSKVFEVPQASEKTDPAEDKPEDSEKKEPIMPITVGEVVVRDGDFQFLDKTIDPDYSTRLHLSEMRVTGLTSQKFKSAVLSAEGTIDRDATIKIDGTVNPFKEDLFVDLNCHLSNMELSPLSPYSGKFIGQAIGKGKLTTTIIIKIEQNTLNIQNQVLLDQFTLGRKVDSPNAIDLPLGMAIALLKDRSGRIDINLPVSGRTDVPQFKVLKTVLNALKSLIVKAATSPFDLVSGIVSGGEKLRYIEFEPGSSKIDEAEARKLDAVAKLMFERPGLKMDLTGFVDMEKDREALAAELIDREIKAEKIKDHYKSGERGPKIEDVVLTPEEYGYYLKELYGGKVAPASDKPLTVDEMGSLVRAQIPVSDQDLRKLAVKRARQVKDVILQDGRIEADRLFLNEAKTLVPKKIKSYSAGRVELGLK